MINLPSQPKIKSQKDNWANFEIEGLYPGYGVTVGNSLRRVLLSSLPGAAITQVKIKGAQHEFTTLKGVLEDVIVILMNLKHLRFKIYGDEPQKAVLKVKGEKEVKSSDFKLPTQVELINKNCHIATLTDKKADLEMEITIEKGVGYRVVDQIKKMGKMEIGAIPVDAIFTPIRRVSYRVENMRVGERTDFDRLNLEIETDGTVSPKDAFAEATDILLKHFNILDEVFREKPSAKEIKEEKGEKTIITEEVSKLKVEDLKLGERVTSALIGGGVKTIGGILKKKKEGILGLESMGPRGLKDVEKSLKKLGLKLE